MSALAVLLILGCLVFIHELGHFLAAKAMRLAVSDFALGFGPTLLKRTWRGTTYRLNAIPLGGYVLLGGLNSLDDYVAIPLWRRLVFLLGGPAANALLVVPLFAVLNALQGHTDAGALLWHPWFQTGKLFEKMLVALAGIFTTPQAVSSVVGVVSVGQEFVAAGWIQTTWFATLISANLALFNLLPVPPLDGGRIVLDVAHRFWPRTRRYMLRAIMAGWVLILALLVLATVLDIGRLVGT